MKLAIFNNLPPGGASRAMYEEVKYLAKNFQVDSYEYNNAKNLNWNLHKIVLNTFKYEYFGSVQSYNEKSRIIRDFDKIVHLKRLNKKIAEDINRFNYDACIVYPDMHIQSPYVLKFLNIPKIYICPEYLRIAHEKYEIDKHLSVLNKIYEHVYRKVFGIIDIRNARQADVIVSNSRFTKNMLNRVYKKESIVNHPGVDSRSFKNVKNTIKNQVLFIGADTQQKGYGTMLKLKKILKQNKIEVIEFHIFQKDMGIDDISLVERYSESICTLCLSQVK